MPIILSNFKRNLIIRPLQVCPNSMCVISTYTFPKSNMPVQWVCLIKGLNLIFVVSYQCRHGVKNLSGVAFEKIGISFSSLDS